MSNEHRGFIGSLTDLVVLIAATGFIAGAVVMITANARSEANRTKCASNLRHIGQSLNIYANDNKGAFPRTYFAPAENPVPTEYTAVNAPNPFAADGPGPNDVSAAMYLLLRTGDITGEVFNCPTSHDSSLKAWVPPAGSTMQSFSNFAGRINLSYAYANPYPCDAARKLGFKMNFTLGSDFAIAADMGRGPIAAATAANASRADMIKANSPNHGGDGQLVLYADGHADWSPTIYAGSPRPVTNAPRDNIYAFGVDLSMTTPSAGSKGAPQDQFDSVLLPTFDLGPQHGPIPLPTAQPPSGVPWIAAIVGSSRVDLQACKLEYSIVSPK